MITNQPLRRLLVESDAEVLDRILSELTIDLYNWLVGEGFSDTEAMEVATDPSFERLHAVARRQLTDEIGEEAALDAWSRYRNAESVRARKHRSAMANARRSSPEG